MAMENPPFVDEFPSYKLPLTVDFPRFTHGFPIQNIGKTMFSIYFLPHAEHRGSRSIRWSLCSIAWASQRRSLDDG